MPFWGLKTTKLSGYSLIHNSYDRNMMIGYSPDFFCSLRDENWAKCCSNTTNLKYLEWKSNSRPNFKWLAATETLRKLLNHYSEQHANKFPIILCYLISCTWVNERQEILINLNLYQFYIQIWLTYHFLNPSKCLSQRPTSFNL